MNITKQGILLGLGSGLFWAISGIFYEELYREFTSVNIFTINIIVFFLNRIHISDNYFFIPLLK